MKKIIIPVILLALILPLTVNAITVDTTLTDSFDLGYTSYCQYNRCFVWDLYYLTIFVAIVNVILIFMLLFINKKIKKDNELIIKENKDKNLIKKKKNIKTWIISLIVLIVLGVVLYIMNIQDKEYYKDTGEYKYNDWLNSDNVIN